MPQVGDGGSGAPWGEAGARRNDGGVQARHEPHTAFAPLNTGRHAAAASCADGDSRHSAQIVLPAREILERTPKMEYYQERRLRSLKLIDDSGDTTYESITGGGFGNW